MRAPAPPSPSSSRKAALGGKSAARPGFRFIAGPGLVTYAHTRATHPGQHTRATRPGGSRFRAGILFYPTVLSTTHNTACGIRHLGNVHRVSGLDLTLGRQRAMLRSNRESHSGVHLTSSVTFGYTASLRCTLTSSVSPRVYGVLPRGVWRACGDISATKFGRTPVGSIAQRLRNDYLRHEYWFTSRILRAYPGASQGT